MNCRIHGEVSIENTYIQTEKRWSTPRKIIRCKMCRKISQDKYRAKPEMKEKISERQKLGRIKYKEKINKTRKVYKEKNRNKINATELKRYYRNHENYLNKNKESRKKAAKELRDSYVKNVIIGRSSLRSEDIPKEMIDAKRELLKLYRKVKELNEM